MNIKRAVRSRVRKPGPAVVPRLFAWLQTSRRTTTLLAPASPRRRTLQQQPRGIVAALSVQSESTLELLPATPLPFRMEAMTGVWPVRELLPDAALERSPVVVERTLANVIPGHTVRVGRLLTELHALCAECLGQNTPSRCTRKRAGRCRCRLLFAGQRFELLPRDDANLLGRGEELRTSMRPVFCGVALHLLGADQPDDPGRVGHGWIDFHLVSVEPVGQRRENGGDELARILIVRKVHPVQQIGAVAGGHEDGLGPAAREQERGDLVRRALHLRQLFVGAADPRRPHGVEIQEQPAPSQHVSIGRRGIGALHDLVNRSCQERRFDRIQRHINARLAVPARDRGGGRVNVVEVARRREPVLPVLRNADLEHVARLVEE